MEQDRERIRLLAVFHYAVAGMAALFALIPLLHLVFGIAMISGRFPEGRSRDLGGESHQEVTELVGWFFVVFASTWILLGLAFAVCLAIAGRNLSQLRHHRYCLVMAALACMFFPFGTALGVFTIIVLTKDSVRAMFPSAPGLAVAP